MGSYIPKNVKDCRYSRCDSFFFFTIAVLLLDSSVLLVFAYNRPVCASWPTDDIWQSELASKLSAEAKLIPIVRKDGNYDIHTYVSQCADYGSNPYLLAQRGDGICMQSPECTYQFCRPHDSTTTSDDDLHKAANLPSYVARVHTPTDISVSLDFANRYDIAVSVKSTGHSWEGSSTYRHSLLIWMAHFDGNSVDLVGHVREITDSCGETYPTTIGIGGGQMWDDVLEVVKENYHVVMGGCRSVSACGGWLQGVGMSDTSRHHGLGIDQVVRFHVVLPDGSPVVADACSEEYSDLFWALRGGGGGTFGVVTHADYKLHPATPISVINFWFDVHDVISRGRSDLIILWLQYWLKVSTTVLSEDSRWNGFFNGWQAYILFIGKQEEAMSLFGDAFIEWFDTEFAPRGSFEGDWFIDPPTSWEIPSWYEFKGGASAYRSPSLTIQTGPKYVGMGTSFGARLIPTSLAFESPDRLVDLLFDLTINGTLQVANSFLGGNINAIPKNATAVHPAMRDAIYMITVRDETGDAHAALREFAPNSISGVAFNHHYAIEPDWREALWGAKNYDRLLSIKTKYDPNNRLNCWHCVGYIGPEVPVETKSSRASTFLSSDEPCPSLTIAQEDAFPLTQSWFSLFDSKCYIDNLD